MHYSVLEWVDGTCWWQLASHWLGWGWCLWLQLQPAHSFTAWRVGRTSRYALKQFLLDERRLPREKTIPASQSTFRSWLWKAELTGTLLPMYSSNILVHLIELEPPESYPVDLALVKPQPTPWKTYFLNHGHPLSIYSIHGFKKSQDLVRCLSFV